MADTGWLTASSTWDIDSYWANDSNVYAEDGVGATATELSIRKWLVAYSFDAAVPAGATIDGIEVRSVHKQVGAGLPNVWFNLWKSAGAAAGTEKGGSENSTSFVERLKGGATDLWGTTWTPSEVNANTFGVGVAPGGSGSDVLHVDILQVKIYYTPAVVPATDFLINF
jgi:hypothetical protein